MNSDAQLQRRRTAQYDAKLNDWIVLEGLRAINPRRNRKATSEFRAISTSSIA